MKFTFKIAAIAWPLCKHYKKFNARHCDNVIWTNKGCP